MAEHLKHGQIRKEHSGFVRTVANSFRKLGRCAVEGLFIATLVGLPASGLADGPKKEPVKIAQANGQGNNHALHPDLAKLPKVSLKEMQDLAKKSEKYQDGDAETRTGFSTTARVVFDRNVLYAIANLCYIKGCNSTVLPIEDKTFGMSVNGEGVGGVNLLELNRLYKLATGKEMRYVRLVVDIFESKYSQYGTGIAVEVVPVEESQGEIQSGIPTVSTTYYTKARQVTEEQYRLTE